MATGRVPTTANSPLTTKGDLFTYSTTQARLAVGSNGDTLVADSAASTGLRWQKDFSVGRNKVINGDFNIWQRGTSFTGAEYTSDRWRSVIGGSGTATISRQTFTPGAAPVSGYEGNYFINYNSVNAADPRIFQNIEDVQTLAGQTVTVSFWAKSATTDAITNISLLQVFGSGGSGTVTTTTAASAITSSWARYSLTISNPSISGKTVGTSSYLRLQFEFKASATFNVDVWGVQIESGSVATPFTTATGTLQGELAACQRYYYRQTADATAVYAHLGQARGDSGTVSIGQTVLPVTMRVAPTSVDYANVAVTDGAAVYAANTISLATNQNDAKFAAYQLNHTSGVTQFRYYYVVSNNNSAGYLGFSAEL